MMKKAKRERYTEFLILPNANGWFMAIRPHVMLKVGLTFMKKKPMNVLREKAFALTGRIREKHIIEIIYAEMD